MHGRDVIAAETSISDGTVLGHTGSTVSPVVTFTPNWRKIFTGESITMTCDVGSTGGRDLTYYWYKDDLVILQVPLDVYEGDDLTLRCHHRSDFIEVYTIFRKDDSIIQELFEIPEIKVTPYPVVEGDEMTLTCDSSLSLLRPRTQLKFAFHKDGRNVRAFTSYNQYGIQSAQVKDSGKYSCEATTVTNSVKRRSQEKLVEVNELFVNPRIVAIRNATIEGDQMTLICITRLEPLRQRTDVQFAFYRDGRNVQEFSSSDQYGVQSAQLEDSGNYSCDMRASNGKVRKSSHFVHITIKELFFTPVLNVSTIKVLEGDTITLMCNTSLSPLSQKTELQFAFYRDGKNVQEFSLSDQYGVQSPQLEDSGNYSCEVRSAVNISKKSEDVFVQIIELFFTPVLNVSTIKVLEGDTITLMCNTSLSPLSQKTELQFAFYRDGKNVQEFSLSDQYGVQSPQLEDSGNYSCEVRSATNISKKSEDVFVQIIGDEDTDYTLQNKIRLLASGILLFIGAFIFYCYIKLGGWP
ncbi:Fc receptor-like protein 6 [Aquarana catesbeiana]|uniref:Fc receptor-like protein 6 n=1 Tax=Aquarana catesbeiana TaxID=8400 RepID=UPI003CC93717